MRALVILAGATGGTLMMAAGGSSSPSPSTTLESLSTTGEQGDLYSYGVGISGNGRFVVINSQATNLVPGDTNDRTDVFVRDRQARVTQRVSVSSTGEQGMPTDNLDGGARAGGISSDGRYVVFQSDAPNLVAGDTNGVPDIFVHDRLTRRTIRVNVGNAGQQAVGRSDFPSIRADGRFVVFSSAASNLVSGDTNGVADIFLRDCVSGKTTRVSVSSRGHQANRESEEPVISAHGRYVAWTSAASNLVRGDTNHLADVFIRDLRRGKTTRVSITSRERQATGRRAGNGSNGPAISADGRYVAFHSDSANLVPRDRNRVADIFVRDRKKGTTRRVSISTKGKEANAESFGPTMISSDGRYVVFVSVASNLVPPRWDDFTAEVFIRDRVAHKTILGSRGNTGERADSWSGLGALSADDRHLVFWSWGGNLVAHDVSPGPDAFVRDFHGRP